MPDQLRESKVYNLMDMEGTEWDMDVLREFCNEIDMELIRRIPIPMNKLWFSAGLQQFVQISQGDTAASIIIRRLMRNNWVWEKANGSAFGVRASAMNLLQDWREAHENGRKASTRVATGVRIWSRPPEGWVKINVDAAIFQDGSIGIDSKSLVAACNGKPGEAYFGTIVLDCIHIMEHIDHVLVDFAYRSANTVAHELTKATYSMSDVGEWHVTPPDFISHFLQLDNI
ncbi:hypothetical protein AgCh_015020 [Apium graveolens]